MNLRQMIVGPRRRSAAQIDVVERDQSYNVLFQEYVDFISSYQGIYYPASSMNQSIQNPREEITADYGGLSAKAYKRDAIVFGCMEARRSHFSEVGFIFRDRKNGRPGKLFSTPELNILAQPYGYGSTTSDLLSRMIQDVDLAGNSYHVRTGDTLARLRPDWVAIVIGSNTQREEWVAGDPDTVVLGYIYFPGGKPAQQKPLVFTADQVVHFAPIYDPQATFLGMSWLSVMIAEVQADLLMTEHKTKYLEQGATPNIVVTFPAGTDRQNFNDVVDIIRRDHEGVQNAYKTLFLAGGADAKALGTDMQQTDFRAVQAAGETRITVAARVPAVIAQISEGLQGSALNAGNYNAARRMFADGTLRPLWRNAAGALSKIITVPPGSELYYDDRDVPFLKEDKKDTAQVQQLQSTALKTLIDAGYLPDAAAKAISTDDLSTLQGQHSGLTSVQLQPMDGSQPALESGGTAAPNGGTAIPPGK